MGVQNNEDSNWHRCMYYCRRKGKETSNSENAAVCFIERKHGDFQCAFMAFFSSMCAFVSVSPNSFVYVCVVPGTMLVVCVLTMLGSS